ncbi:hypothetical protein H6F77_17885 [Microcoleus sp. FACHB-831]|uniref:hypothetical protein n=1 Tax=Microcoleus sp. FACHB-831 TaxID=2692827 RepID=UPI0019B32BA7|nr:hypothetical protein [Microcoleus sp. FACHB-831]MBD1922925.1 hypothetical protein [Microcoleus sp. FACHB-831]
MASKVIEQQPELQALIIWRVNSPWILARSLFATLRRAAATIFPTPQILDFSPQFTTKLL